MAMGENMWVESGQVMQACLLGHRGLPVPCCLRVSHSETLDTLAVVMPNL